MSLSATALRAVLAATAVGLVATAVPGSAAPAPAPQIVDAKGDAIDGKGAHDVQSVRFNKTAKGFAVTMTLGAPQTTQDGVTYEITAQTVDCGTFSISWSPRTGLGGRDQVGMSCGADSGFGPYTIIAGSPRAKGSTLTWTFNKKSFPNELKKGATFTDLRAGVDPNEPVFGIFGPAALGVPVRLDDAVGKGSFTF